VTHPFAICLAALFAWSTTATALESTVSTVRSKDGTTISFECAGSGPELLIVHGGTGDRTRWTPMFEHLGQAFTVCAMDRRGRGGSGDGPTYSLAREAEDVAAVAASRGRPVAVLGHSFGGVVALEAALLNPSITKLVLYEPPVRVPANAAELAKMEALIAAGDRAAATTIFLRDVVLISPSEVSAMQTRPAWKTMVASIDGSLRQHRALAARPWDAAKIATLETPTLLLLGERTASPHLQLSVKSLAAALPRNQVIILKGQEHNSMDGDRETLAATVQAFLEPRR
jgi:pimeloyl-ACP methyl ester carboxylesterase